MCWLCSRRYFMKAAMSMLLLAGRVEGMAAAELPKLCVYGDNDLTKLQRSKESGNKQLDRALISELKEITATLGVSPSFQYIVDDEENAVAMQCSLGIPGTNGTVLIGLNLLKSLMAKFGGAAVAGVCAHECGHIYQLTSTYPFFPAYYRNGAYQRTEDCVRLVELHADFMAGYYMGRRKHWAGDQIKVFLDAIVRGMRHGDPSSHGTAAQRTQAIEKGYATADQRVRFNREVAVIGEKYVSTL